MTAQWRLTGLEFIVACELAGRDTLPHPLRYLPARMGAAEFGVLKRKTQSTVQALDPDFFTALRVLVKPQVRTSIDGVTARTRVRVYVAEAGGFTAVARQLPGETDAYGGDVVVRLGSTVQDALPTAAPGRRATIHGLTTSAAIERFLAGDAVSTGDISVGLGARGGWLGAVKWIDRADGRYFAVTSGQWTTIAPATESVLAHELMKLRRTETGALA